MIKLGILIDGHLTENISWSVSGGLHDIGNRGWMPIQVSTEKVSTSYFNSVQNVHYVKNVELRFQTQYVYNACIGFRAKFQNNMVSEISTFCTHRNLNNMCNNLVNTDYEEVSAYNCVLSMDESPISTALDHQNDHIQSNVENSTPKIGPSLFFEASGIIFGVVYHDVSQETFRDSSTFCPSVGSIEGVAKNVAISKNSTSGGSKNGSKNEASKAQMANMSIVAISKNSTSGGSKNGSKNGASKAQMAKMSRNKASKSFSYTSRESISGQRSNDDSQNAPAPTTSFRNNDNKEECVKKSEHSFEYQKCPTGGTLVPTDNDNFDVWTLLGSSIKKCIQKNSDVFGSKLTSLRHIKTDPVIISIRGGRFQKLKPCYRACPIPAHWYTKGRSILANLEEQGLIVRVTEASEYCSPCFFIAKPYDPSQGLFCSGDEFGQRLEIILSNYPKFRNFLRVVDDIAVCGELLGELLEQFSLFLDICREHHLTQKFQMCYPEHSIRFAGMIMSSKGLSPDSDKMSVIRDFPIPNNRTDLRSWLGLCQRFSMWYPELASCQSGLRHLVRDDVPFEWSSKMTGQMEATKHLLCGDVHVHSYDMKLVPTIFVDGSILHGASYILVQQEGRFFSADDYKSCLDVIETPLDGRSVDPQNNTNVKLLGKGGGDCSPPIEGGETSPTYDSICDDGGFGTETTDCFVSKGHASTHYSVRPCETELKRENQISSPINWVGVDPFYFGGSHFLFMIDGFSQTESSIIMECASVYNPQSNSTAEQNLVILKNCLKFSSWRRGFFTAILHHAKYT